MSFFDADTNAQIDRLIEGCQLGPMLDALDEREAWDGYGTEGSSRASAYEDTNDSVFSDSYFSELAAYEQEIAMHRAEADVYNAENTWEGCGSTCYPKSGICGTCPLQKRFYR